VRRLRLVMMLAVTGCCAGATLQRPLPAPPDAGQGAARPTAAEQLFATWTAIYNRGDIAGAIALFADDAVVVGVGDCQGKSCVGRGAIERGFIAPSIWGGIKWKTTTLEADATRLRVSWSARVQRKQIGIDHIRGWTRLTVENGKIVRWVNTYDLHDPETVVWRAAFGEVSFVMRLPGSVEASPARALLWGADDGTAVSLYLMGTLSDAPGLTARVHRGDCSQPGALVHELAPVADGRSDSFIAAKLEMLVGEQTAIVVTDRAQRVVLCGEVPKLASPPAAEPQPGQK
jgi:ketosteroid isomerase-like protein